MRTPKLVYMLNKMLEPYGEINTRSVNLGIWECQKQGAMKDYGFLPISDGPLSKELFADIALLKNKSHIIEIVDDKIRSNDNDMPEIAAYASSKYPDEAEVIRYVVDYMRQNDLLTNEENIKKCWYKELNELNYINC